MLQYIGGMQRCCNTTAACNGVAIQRRAVQDEESTVRYAMLDKLSSLYLATSAGSMLPPAYLAFVALFAGEDDKQKCAKVRYSRGSGTPGVLQGYSRGALRCGAACHS